MVKFNINISNKTFYLLIAILAVLVVSGVAFAIGGTNPTVMGHDIGEIAVPSSGCADGKVLKVSSGVWACGDVSSGGAVSSVSGSSGISVSPTTGLVVVSPNMAILQARVTGTCASGAIKSIDSSGNVNCGSLSTCDPSWVSTGLTPGSTASRVLYAGTSVSCSADSGYSCPGVTTSGTPNSITFTCSGPASSLTKCTVSGQVCYP